jgi:hypothetical protein
MAEYNTAAARRPQKLKELPRAIKCLNDLSPALVKSRNTDTSSYDRLRALLLRSQSVLPGRRG